MNSKEALERLKHWCPPIGDLTPEFDLIETDLDLLEKLRKKLDRKVESKEYHDEKSNTYHLSTLLTYEIKEKWNEKEIEALRQFLLNLGGIQKDLNRLDELESAKHNLQNRLIEANAKLFELNEILRIIKEVIQFNKVLPKIEFDDDGNVQNILSGISLQILRDIENKERKLFREWILKECFPTELNILQIIKEKRVDIHNLLYSSNVEEYNKFVMNYNQELCNTLLTQEEYELLKEWFE